MVHQWDFIGADNQLWTIEPTSDGYYKIKSKIGGKCLDIVGMDACNGAHIQIWEDVDGDNQKWSITQLAAKVAAEEKEPAAQKPAAKKTAAKKPAAKKPAAKKTAAKKPAAKKAKRPRQSKPQQKRLRPPRKRPRL